ncbi:uncharacterized protein [Equus caballus]|uniref:uncharacterized protein n=1 Tax=Equus caballus TaxID=9796 RepID=UPI0038B2461B
MAQIWPPRALSWGETSSRLKTLFIKSQPTETACTSVLLSLPQAAEPPRLHQQRESSKFLGACDPVDRRWPVADKSKTGRVQLGAFSRHRSMAADRRVVRFCAWGLNPSCQCGAHRTSPSRPLGLVPYDSLFTTSSMVSSLCPYQLSTVFCGHLSIPSASPQPPSSPHSALCWMSTCTCLPRGPAILRERSSLTKRGTKISSGGI